METKSEFLINASFWIMGTMFVVLWGEMILEEDDPVMPVAVEVTERVPLDRLAAEYMVVAGRRE